MSCKSYECSDRNKPGPKRQLPTWSEFVMTLIWLRLGLPVQLLGTLFGLSSSHVRKTVFTWVHAMNAVLVPILLNWPSRDTIKNTMPKCFKSAYLLTRIVIDCTEIFIQKPSDPEAQHKTVIINHITQ